jgi:hypothetical protein
VYDAVKAEFVAQLGLPLAAVDGSALDLRRRPAVPALTLHLQGAAAGELRGRGLRRARGVRRARRRARGPDRHRQLPAAGHARRVRPPEQPAVLRAGFVAPT